MRSIMAARAVDLPESVVPVQRTKPRCSSQTVASTRELKLLDGANLRRDDAENHADVAALLEDVDAEASEAGDAIGHVELGGLFEFLLLPVGHHAEGHGQHLFRRDAGDLGDRVQQAVDTKIGVVADLEVQVGRPLFDGAAEQIINASDHSEIPQREASHHASIGSG